MGVLVIGWGSERVGEMIQIVTNYDRNAMEVKMKASEVQ